MTEKMKPSGIAWIGDIPSGWGAKRIKYVISDIKDGTHGTFDRVESGELLLSAKNVFDDGIHIGSNESEISYSDYTSIVANGFPQRNDVLLCCVGTIGRCCVYNFEKPLAFQRSVSFLRPLADTIPSFLKYALQSDSTTVQEQLLLNKSAQEGLYMGSVREMVVAMPDTVSEQRAIADFLDTQCAKIDSVIADIEKQIETLQKYKKSLITETVTRGLDRSVPMKDSGIVWIGEIPKHWNINKTRYLASLCSGATPSKDVYTYWEGNIPWVSSQEVKSDIITDTSLHISEEAIRSCSTKLMPAGTLVMVVRSGILQHTIPVALLGVPATINQDIKAFVFKPEMIPAYYKYYIQGENDALLNVLIKDKTTVESIDNNLLLSLRVMVPPIQEQKDIVNYLDERCSKIDSIISDKQAQLDAIIQHKKSLIYEYVTGKKRVTEVN